MKVTTVLYATLALVGAVMAAYVPITIYRSGSGSIPAWSTAVNPGPLSNAHAFIGEACEACHVPLRGTEPAGCIGCHAAAAPDLVSKPSTSFHASINECAGCHIEHLGRDRRPINMNHAVLAAARHSREFGTATPGAPARTEGLAQDLERIRMLLAESGATLAGSPPANGPLPPRDAAALDCAGCHATRDPHRMLFGRDCQSCHGVDSWRILSFRHPSPRSRDCAQCHQAPPSHYMMHFMMDQEITGQRQARVEQCFLCHQTDNWNNIRGVGWVDMH